MHLCDADDDREARRVRAPTRAARSHTAKFSRTHRPSYTAHEHTTSHTHIPHRSRHGQSQVPQIAAVSRRCSLFRLPCSRTARAPRTPLHAVHTRPRSRHVTAPVHVARPRSRAVLTRPRSRRAHAPPFTLLTRPRSRRAHTPRSRRAHAPPFTPCSGLRLQLHADIRFVASSLAADPTTRR